MTDTQKRDLDILFEDLHNEMGCCDDCGTYIDYGAAACVDCATNGNIEHIKGLICSLSWGE